MCHICTEEYIEYSGDTCPICHTKCDFVVSRAADSSIPLNVYRTGCHSSRIEGRFKQVLECQHPVLRTRFDNLRVAVSDASNSHCENRTENYRDVHFALRNTDNWAAKFAALKLEKN